VVSKTMCFWRKTHAEARVPRSILQSRATCNLLASCFRPQTRNAVCTSLFARAGSASSTLTLSGKALFGRLRPHSRAWVYKNVTSLSQTHSWEESSGFGIHEAGERTNLSAGSACPLPRRKQRLHPQTPSATHKLAPEKQATHTVVHYEGLCWGALVPEACTHPFCCPMHSQIKAASLIY